MIRKLVVCLLVLTVGAAGVARAGIVVVEPDAFGAGTDISSLYLPLGVTLSAASTSSSALGNSPSVYAVDPMDPFYDGDANFAASTGSLVFGHDGTLLGSLQLGHSWQSAADIYLRADFAVATDFVSIDLISNNGSDQGSLWAYDASGVLLATYTTAPLAQPAFETMSITRGSADIAYILASGIESHTAGLDNLRFNRTVVPEPGTLAVLGLALICGGFARRRKRA